MRPRDVKVPLIAYEEITAPFERIIKKLWITVTILALLFFLSMGYIIYGMQWQTETIVVSQEAETEEGSNVLINNSGGLLYGEDEDETEGNH